MEDTKATDLNECKEGLEGLIAKLKEFEEEKRRMDEESERVTAFVDEHNDFICSLSKEAASKLIGLIAIKAADNPVRATLIMMTSAYLSIKTLDECSIVNQIYMDGDDDDGE